VISRRRLLSNTVIVIAGNTLQRVLAFGTTLILARGLGAERFGTYAFVAAYMFMFSFIADMGLERVISRELARRPVRAGELLGTGFIIRGALAVLGAVVAIAVAWLLRLPALTWWCIFLAAVGWPLSMEALIRSFFQSRFQMHYVYFLALPGNVAQLISTAAIVWLGGGLLAVFGAALAIGTMTLALMLWVALPKMQVVWRVDAQLFRYLWWQSWELGVVILIFLVAQRIDQLLLFWLRGPIELAHYAAAVKIVEALNLIPESIMVTVFPLLAATELSAPARFERIYTVTARFLIVVVFPLALVITFERDLVIRVLFGAGYNEAANALTILAWWMAFAYTGALYLGLMVVRSQQRVIAIVSLLSLAVNIALNIAWIPRWGAAGAAAANFVSSASAFGLFCFAAQTRSIMLVCCEQAVRPLVAVATALIVALLLAPALRVFAALPLYAIMLLMLGGIGRQDWALARTLWEPAGGQR
jgi:O-antigen/teichoic acid export membrane protein